MRIAVLCAAAVGCSEASLEEPERSTAELVSADVVAGAVNPPDLGFLAAEPTAITYYVDPSGSDSNPGTAAAPFRTVAKGVESARPGNVVFVRNDAVYVENINLGSLGAVSGRADAPIVLLGDPEDQSAVLRSAADRAVLTLNRNYWIVRGFDFDMNGHRGTVVRVSGAHHVLVANSLIHGTHRAHGISLSGTTSDVAIEGNAIFDNQDLSPAGCDQFEPGCVRRDSDGIAFRPDVTRVLVRSNSIGGNSGDGVDCNGVADGEPGTADPSDLLFEDNDVANNLENGYDFDACRRVTVRGGNVYQVHPTAYNGGNNSKGTAIALGPNAKQIRIEDTHFWDVCRAISIGSTDATQRTEDVVITRTIIALDAVQNNPICNDWTGARDIHGIFVLNAQRLDIFHNTFDAIEDWTLRVGISSSPEIIDLDFWNNLVRSSSTSARWIQVDRTRHPTFESDYNLFFSTVSGTSRFRDGSTSRTLASWQTASGQDLHSAVADPRFIPTTFPFLDGYFTEPGSPARDTALPGAGGTVCGAGPDKGARESCDSAVP